MSITFTKTNKNNVDKAIKGEKSYKKLTSEEWHQFVQNYNFDSGLEPFEWLINQKVCDRGTALCLYWNLNPEYFCDKIKIPTVDNKSMFEQNYKLITEIEKKYLDGFYNSELFLFDPKNDFITSDTNLSCIPKIMQERTNGILFDRIDVEFAFLRNPSEKELKSIESKIKNAISIIQNTNPAFGYNETGNTVNEIVNSVEYWKGKELGKINIKNLSYLWLDCLCKKYNWNWVIWDYETGKYFGVTNQSKTLTCLSDTIIMHTINGFQPSKIILKLFSDLQDSESKTDLKNSAYGGIGLLFSSGHLKFRE